MAKTLYDKLWDAHVVETQNDDQALLYIDRHLLHEVTSPQAFEGLQLKNRAIWRVGANVAVPDHNVPTTANRKNIQDPFSKLQVDTLRDNCQRTGIAHIDIENNWQGIVHVIGPELGLTLPGMTIVCGDSHTSTHGALATLSMGIGTSEVEHVLATQCLIQKKSKNLCIQLQNTLGAGVSAKDIILAIIGRLGTAGATGYAIEYAGEAIENLSIEGRMTICNMSIEAGARCGMVAVDNKTIDFVKNRPFAPTGELWEQAVATWMDLKSDEKAVFDRREIFDAKEIMPQVTWGTSPGMVSSVLGHVPDPQQESDLIKRSTIEHALAYMGLEPGQAIQSISPAYIFIGSCTNSRIEDLREVAYLVKGKKIAKNIKQALVVPGSGLIKQQAEQEGIAQILVDAGFVWREAGCSMCLGMNPDKLTTEDRCASTSNRNFEGRQGAGSRTHLVSPQMAAAAAIYGHFVDVRELS